MPEYILLTYGHNEPITAKDKAAAIKAAKEYAEKYNIHGYILMNSRADIIYSVDKDGSEIPIQ